MTTTTDGKAAGGGRTPGPAPVALEQAALTALSDSITDRVSDEALLGRVCEVIVEHGPVAGAWISCALPDGSVTIGSAHPDELTELVGRQFALRQGPCVDSWSTAEPVFEDRLRERAASRWPAWAQDASGLLPDGVTTLRSDPFATVDGGPGAVCVVGSAKAVRSTSASSILTLAQVAATQALAVRSLEHFRDLSGQLQQALRTRVRIEQAKGALARHYGIGVDVAFERLRWLARDQGRRLHEVADDVVRQLERCEHVEVPAAIDGRVRATPPLRIISIPAGLRLLGAADISAVPVLTAALEQLDGRTDALVDLRELDFLDAQCGNALLQCGRQRQEHGAHLTLAGSQPLVRQVLELLGATAAPGIRVAGPDG